MSNKAKICRVVLDEMSIDLDDLADRVGLVPRTLEPLLGALCRDGTLRRNGNYVTVGNETRARVTSESDGAMPLPPRAGAQPVAPAPDPVKPFAIDRSKLAKSLTIEKGLAIPPVQLGRRFDCQWPFKEMALDDSFAVPVPEGTKPQILAQLLRGDAARYDKLFPPFYVAIRVAEDGKSVRLWRVAKPEPAFGRKPKVPETTTAAPVTREGAGARPRRAGKVPAKALL